MSNKSEAIKIWRKNTKQKMIASMGGHCQICNYDKCPEALDLHHINPEEKEFNFGAIIANPKKWEDIKTELNKCILLCSNCHREIHNDYVKLPEYYQKFDETLIPVELLKLKTISYCPVCNKEKHNHNTTCSKTCAATLSGKIDWDSIDIVDMIENQKLTKISIGEKLGCSDAAVGKRYRKLKAQLQLIK